VEVHLKEAANLKGVCLRLGVGYLGAVIEGNRGGTSVEHFFYDVILVFAHFS